MPLTWTDAPTCCGDVLMDAYEIPNADEFGPTAQFDNITGGKRMNWVSVDERLPDSRPSMDAAFEYDIEEIERAATATWESLGGIEYEPDQTYGACD